MTHQDISCWNTSHESWKHLRNLFFGDKLKVKSPAPVEKTACIRPEDAVELAIGASHQDHAIASWREKPKEFPHKTSGPKNKKKHPNILKHPKTRFLSQFYKKLSYAFICIHILQFWCIQLQLDVFCCFCRNSLNWSHASPVDHPAGSGLVAPWMPYTAGTSAGYFNGEQKILRKKIRERVWVKPLKDPH